MVSWRGLTELASNPRHFRRRSVVSTTFKQVRAMHPMTAQNQNDTSLELPGEKMRLLSQEHENSEEGLESSPDARTPNAEDKDDQELAALLRRMAAEDQMALRLFYKRLNRTVFKFVQRRLADSHLAEEVVVETLYEAWRGARRFEGRSKVTTWVLGIAHHKAMDKLRGVAAARRHLESLDDDAEQVADMSLHSYQRITARQQTEQVNNCMALLPDVQREALYMVFYEDLSLKEVALRQSCPENTVKTRLFHARRKMRQCLDRQTL
jgi:RNA polymerase sigma-70 factor (ECF subfamily)